MDAATTSDDSPETPPPKKRAGGIKGRSGPPGNTNAVKAGLRAATGKLPRGFSWVRRTMSALERMIVDEWRAKSGTVSTASLLRVQSFIRLETNFRLAQRWLAAESDKMSAADKLTWLTRIGQFSDARDRALDRLGLDRQAGVLTADDLFAHFQSHEATDAPQ